VSQNFKVKWLKWPQIALSHAYLIICWGTRGETQGIPSRTFSSDLSARAKFCPLSGLLCQITLGTALAIFHRFANVTIREAVNVVLVHACGLTVKHILMECVDLNDIRNKHFVASSIKDLFENVEAQNIIDFINKTRFYMQL